MKSAIRTETVSLVLLVLLAALSNGVAYAQGLQLRHITLHPIDPPVFPFLAPWADSRGNFSIGTYPPDHPQFGGSFTNFNVWNTPPNGPVFDTKPYVLHNGNAFTFYAFTAAEGWVRLSSFNTVLGSYSAAGGFPDDPAWKTDPVIVEVWIDFDDGIAAPFTNCCLIMRGETD